MKLKRTMLVHVLASIGLLTATGSAIAGFYSDENKSNKINPDASGNYVVEGNLYVDGHSWYGEGKKLEVSGDLLNVKQPATNPKLAIYSSSLAIVKGDVKINELSVNGELNLGNSMTVDKLAVNNGLITDLSGNVLTQKVTIKNELWNTDSDLVFHNLVTEGSRLQSTGGSITILGGQLGTADKSLNVLSAKNGASIFFKGNAFIGDVQSMDSESKIEIDGTLTLTGSNSHGSGFVKVNDLIVADRGWMQFDGMTMEIENDMVVQGGTLGILPSTKFSIGNTLTLQKDAFMQYQSLETPLTLKTVVFEKDSQTQDGLQTYGAALNIEKVIVKTAGRIDAWGKANGGNADANNPTQINLGVLEIADNASFAVTNSRDNNDDTSVLAKTTIGSLDLGNQSTFESGVWKSEDKFRGASQIVVNNLSGANGSITNHNNTMTVGENGIVKYVGQIEDKNNGISLSLNQDSEWTLTEESCLGRLVMKGGTTNISTTDDSLTVNTLQGSQGTVILDVNKTNTIHIASSDKTTKIEVQASENADTVSPEQASGMIERLEGVSNKIGTVKEGMYNGAISVDQSGNATVSKNTLMADTIELASASTLSLNRILSNDVRKRLGDVRSAEGSNGVWARYDGGKLSGDGTQNEFNTIHIGADTSPFDENSMRFGLAASYTNGDVEYTRGSSELDAYSVAAYGTWMAENGLFADVIARVSKAESDMTVDGLYKGKLENIAYSLSGELGWRLNINNMFYIEPQVEAIYTYIDSDKLTLGATNKTFSYEVEGFDSFMGRIGFASGMKCPNDKGDMYVRASVVHEFLGDASIRGANGAMIENDGKDTWVEYGIGANFNITKNTYVWADVERTAGATVEEDWRGTVGVRYAF